MKTTRNEYRQLLQHYLAPQWATVLLMTILLLISIGLQLVGPQIVRTFLDAARSGAPERALIQLAILFITIALLQQAMYVLAQYWSYRVAWTATNALRGDLTEHLLHLDLNFHKTHTAGELIERVDGDVNELSQFFSSFAVQLVGNGLLLLGVLVIVYREDVRFGLALTLCALLAVFLLDWVRTLGTKAWEQDRAHSAAYFGYLGEVITAAEDLRTSGALDYAIRRMFEHLRAWLPVQWRAASMGGLVWMTAASVFALLDVVVYGLGGRLYQLGALSLGTVYLVVAYGAMLAEPIEMIRSQLQNLQRADASILRVRQLLQTASKLRNGHASVPTGALAVEFCGVHFGYAESTPLPMLAPEGDRQNVTPAPKSATVLDNLSFTLAPGRVLGLLGRTGSGKTTLARLLFRQYDPQQGHICLGGVDLRDADLATLRSHVGLVTQDVQLFEASLRDNLTFFEPKITDERLLNVINKVGLQAWFARLPHGLDTVISSASLSAGEAQLLAFARVFIKEPGLVILDEASSRLDPATELLLERAVDHLLRGRTVIIIAHRLATIERADEILILDQGHILEHGARVQLAADPTSRFAQLRRTSLMEVLA